MGTQAWQNRNFYLVLIGIFSVHACLMLTQIDMSKVTQWSSPKSLKVKLIQEAIQEIASQPKRQIVQSEDSQNQEKPKEAFLSDKDRSFERETRAKSIETFKHAAKGNSTATNIPQQASASRHKADFKKLKLSDIGVESGDPLPRKVSRSPASLTTKGVENGDPLSQGLSATNDYVEEVALGDFTHLNTVEYKFYGFFHRIRQKLEQFWGKSIQEKAEALFKAGRRLPASENLTTSLQVTLNERGEIIGVRVLGASGVRELDEAAIESFNQAGPFPNPPKELLVNGKATIEWGFVVKS
jgi:TonB family protein